jgi:hypothetical protein
MSRTLGCHPLVDMRKRIAIVAIIYAAKALEFVVIDWVDVLHYRTALVLLSARPTERP